MKKSERECVFVFVFLEMVHFSCLRGESESEEESEPERSGVM